MKKLALLFLASMSFSLVAAEKVDKTLDVSANEFVEIHNLRGEISISGWSNNQVKVSGTLDEMAQQFIFKSENGHTLIKVKLPRDSRYRSRKGSNLKIMLPQTAKMSFSGVATDLKLNNIEGGVAVNSVSGDIVATQLKGRTYINSVSGDLILKQLQGALQASTVSGDLYANVNCKKIEISGVSSDISIAVDEFESVSISNVSGGSALSGKMLSGGELQMSSVSGDAFYLLDGELNARVSIDTAPGGDITNEYSDDKPKSSFINSHELQFTSGDGEGVVRMSTVSGDVGLKRKQ